MKKKVVSLISGVLISTMCLTPCVQASTMPMVDAVGHYIGENTDEFIKISHPNKKASDKDINVADGVLDYLGDGKLGISKESQGDRGQGYCWASLAYGDWVYVSTLFSPMMQTIGLMDSGLGHDMDAAKMKDMLDKLYEGEFFVEEEDGKNPGSALSKINVKTGEVVNIMSVAKNGIDAPFRNGVEYNGKLYFCGAINGIPSVYEIDPEKNDEFRCVYKDETMMTPSAWEDALKEQICPSIRGLATYKDNLVISCLDLSGNPYVAITNDIDKGFTKIASAWSDEDKTQKGELFGYPACHLTDSIYGGSIWEIKEFNDKLYVAICTGTPENAKDNGMTFQSFAIVEGTCNGDATKKESWTWKPIVGDKKDGAKYTFGIDPERTRSGACHMIVYNDKLYIGEYNDTEVALINILFDGDARFMAENLKQSVNLYRMDKDYSMDLVIGDKTKMFPNGSLSKIGSGFDRPENQYIWQMKEYKDKLYLGTFDESSLLRPLAQISNGDIINFTPEQWKTFIEVLNDVLNGGVKPRPDEKPEVKPNEKPEVKPNEKPEVKPNEKPEVKPDEKPSKRNITVRYIDENGKVILTEDVTVTKDDKLIKVKAPEGYILFDKNDIIEINDTIDSIDVAVVKEAEEKPEFRYVRVNYKDMSGNIVATQRVKVEYGKLSMTVEAPEGYKLFDTNNVISIDDSTKIVDVIVVKEEKPEIKPDTPDTNPEEKPSYRWVRVNYKDSSEQVIERKNVKVDYGRLSMTVYPLEGYNLYDTNNVISIDDDVKSVDVYIYKKPYEKPIDRFISVNYKDNDGNTVVFEKNKVEYGKLSMTVEAPEGYKLADSNNVVVIDDSTEEINIQITKNSTEPESKSEFRYVRVNFKDPSGSIVSNKRIKVEYGKNDIQIEAPEGYELADSDKLSIDDTTETVNVNVIRTAISIMSNYSEDEIEEYKDVLEELNEGNKLNTKTNKNPKNNSYGLKDFQKSVLDLGDMLEQDDDLSDEKKLELKKSFAESYNRLYKYYNGKKTQSVLPDFIKDIYDEIFNKENLEKVNAIVSCIDSLNGCEEGFDFLVSEDGIKFDVISRTGLGDGHNQGLRTFAVNNSKDNPWMVVGTANPFYGGQVWLLNDGVLDNNKPEVKPNNPDSEIPNPEKPEVKPEEKPEVKPENPNVPDIDPNIKKVDIKLKVGKSIVIPNVKAIKSNSNPDVVSAKIDNKDLMIIKFDYLSMNGLSKGEADIVATMNDDTDRLFHVTVVDNENEKPNDVKPDHKHNGNQEVKPNGSSSVNNNNTAPKTGDDTTSPIALISIFVIAGAAIFIFTKQRSDRNKKDSDDNLNDNIKTHEDK